MERLESLIFVDKSWTSFQGLLESVASFKLYIFAPECWEQNLEAGQGEECIMGEEKYWKYENVIKKDVVT